MIATQLALRLKEIYKQWGTPVCDFQVMDSCPVQLITAMGRPCGKQLT